MSKKIVIIGSGFGGIYTYLGLKPFIESHQLEIMIISKNNYFLFTPLLHEVATGGLNPHNVLQPIRSIVSDNTVGFIEESVERIDIENKQVILVEKNIPYDYLILATGAKTNFYNTKITNSEIFELKDISDARKIRNHIIESFEEAVKETKAETRKKWLTFAVIGAGATGVELFTEIHDYVFSTLYGKYSKYINKKDIKIYLINKASKVLDRFDEKISAYAEVNLRSMHNVEILNNHEIKEITDNTVCLMNENRRMDIKSKNIYWVAGVMPLIPQIKGQLELLPSGRVNIEKTLNLKSNPEVFAIGDCAGEYSMLAQIAVRQAKTAAENIILSIKEQALNTSL